MSTPNFTAPPAAAPVKSTLNPSSAVFEPGKPIQLSTPAVPEWRGAGKGGRGGRGGRGKGAPAENGAPDENGKGEVKGKGGRGGRGGRGLSAEAASGGPPLPRGR